MARKLASVQYVHDVWPIEEADKVEAVGVLGWTCVAKRGEFKVGDWCVYFEIDSFLPVASHFEFLRSSSNGTIIGALPDGVVKTEEARIQAEPNLLKEFMGLQYRITTKMDGTSVSMYLIDSKFGVCGHNYEYADDGACSFWDYAHNNEVEERLRTANVGEGNKQ